MTPRLPGMSSKQIIKALQSAGFEYAPKKGKGSHVALCKIDNDNRKRLVIVPQGKNIPKGTILSIIDQAGLNKEDFIELL